MGGGVMSAHQSLAGRAKAAAKPMAHTPSRPRVVSYLRLSKATDDPEEDRLGLDVQRFELRRANEILKAASVFFAGELDPHRPR
jgi:hypothetical protein